ncbi:hypothetical protein PF66_02392 [Pseudomonas asplenii]|uniref:Uncharacterized protein n=1 Tax=Pseudomonas asplenii TaxID=53407 RepID=A0A0N0E4A9_9PSED|nr:hypothetical protein [Pseudomonas fuscovaginae]KPA91054.1 hypothetical protein PF66_02392 [Pseudomonas fuscovaginae]
MTHAQDTIQAQAALLRNDSGIATPVTDCGCEAASIIAPFSATTEGLVPHEKLREAATPKASLIALDRPPAQPAKGYKHPTSTAGSRAGGPHYCPADLTNVRPEEWEQMLSRRVTDVICTSNALLQREAAQLEFLKQRQAAKAASDFLLVSHPDGDSWVVKNGDKHHQMATRLDHLKIEQLHIFPDDDQVNRLREELYRKSEAVDIAKELLHGSTEQCKHLRAKLDERDELLRDCFTAMIKGGYSKPLRERIKSTLSINTEKSEQASSTRHQQSDCLQASSLREAMEREAASGRPCALIVGDTRVQVTYHGLKWYHDLQKTGERSQSLAIEEFDQVLTEALNIDASERAAQAKAVTP